MTARCMWFGSIHVARLVDPLQPSDSVFLVKLRALCQIRCPFKILDLEKITAAFRSSRHDLGRDNFGESPSVQSIAKRCQSCGLHTEDIADCAGAKRQRPVLDQGFQADALQAVSGLEWEILPCA